MRLAPLDSKNQCKHRRKQVTLIRLELLAVVIGVQVINFVTSELKLLIAKRMLFTDSECVLYWIKATKQLPVFTQNWIDEIRKEEDLVFGYVSSVQNPADFATRDLSALEISGCKLWWHGPDWLQYDESKWPTSNLLDITPEKLKRDLTRNVESQITYEATNLVKEAAGESEKFRLSPLGIDETKYSSLWKLLCITAICLKFIKYRVWNKCSQALQEQMFLKCAVLKRLFSDMKKQSLYYTEIHNTTLLWVYVIQCRQFCEVFTAIRKNELNCLQKQLGLDVNEFGII